MNYKRVGTGQASRKLYKKVPLTSGGWEYSGDEYGMVEVLVDIEALIRAIGHKALRSPRGISKLQEGSVVVKVMTRQRREKE